MCHSVADHPHPGVPYEGTHRTAYLPDTEEGNEIANLFKRAFRARLSFQVGTSITTGRDNCVVWNGIHHKTSTRGGETRCDCIVSSFGGDSFVHCVPVCVSVWVCL